MPLISDTSEFSKNNEKDVLFKTFISEDGLRALETISKWRQEFQQLIYEKLASLPLSLKERFIERANDALLKQHWKLITANDYLEYSQSGNRYEFEEKIFAQRVRLADLVIGIILTSDDTYLQEIVNGLWLMIEETTWVLPAHINALNGGEGIADVTQNRAVIDICSSETALLVAWIQFLIEDRLMQISPLIPKRIDYELNKRLINPYLETNFWFMRSTGNWNIWVNTNVLQTALLTKNISIATVQQIVVKALRSVDIFLNAYPSDGACFEGSAYWPYSGGRLIEFIYMLSLATNNQLNWSSNELFKTIGQYIYKAHISGKRFLSFADSLETFPKEFLSPHRIYLYGQYFDDTKMKQFAVYIKKIWEIMPETKSFIFSSGSGNLNDFIKYVLIFSSLNKEKKENAPLPQQSYFSNTQLVALRSNELSVDGLFFAVKGGNNGEGHNHNDVGSFVIYINGEPALIDIGVGNYTEQTFSKNRYDIWYMQSQWHNGCPTINGYQQKDGIKYSATNFSFIENKPQVVSMDIANAYPEEASVKSWNRMFVFHSEDNSLELIDSYQLLEWKDRFSLHLITNLDVFHTRNFVTFTNENIKLLMKYDFNLFVINIEKQFVTDYKLKQSWGEYITRVVLTVKENSVIDHSLKGEYNLFFNKVDIL